MTENLLSVIYGPEGDAQDKASHRLNSLADDHALLLAAVMANLALCRMDHATDDPTGEVSVLIRRHWDVYALLEIDPFGAPFLTSPLRTALRRALGLDTTANEEPR